MQMRHSPSDTFLSTACHWKFTQRAPRVRLLGTGRIQKRRDSQFVCHVAMVLDERREILLVDPFGDAKVSTAVRLAALVAAWPAALARHRESVLRNIIA
eukprot:591443-Prymnesium_polylepis.1